ncbi:MAG TPA: hypothetical protein DEE98_03765 [Elusimicrobia bacterium]|nr:MAG: hypothetical protein A2278_01095 [Elusimicrobia bacterium RIFOXYA12_FULL_49_49]OGS06630.1 MAG: hypothetical protein A2204_03350 [Elusimicrobia bacterium RIFOXYA1_FULL_47_7]OGS11081.1 MAG: hypothetical protein A2386_03655 [Elusimicrobia bacterium RIFOXYB1_FULL_48_9]OGS15793.1 MAG: hypothetical protein A2251_03995 [Elusimicrobia bacterium RIFOXYA2_FULL_47_53]OGS25981.1 MAG: hypothetical protein A2339_05385 [Elusimicrobia bacterium RIFOXYB12_FULL_50_12]OGS31125.1 MAG: hypothetical protein
MKKYLCLSVILPLCFFSAALALDQGTTAQQQAVISTAAVAAAAFPREEREVNSALSDLNYKLEYLKGRYDSVSAEIEAMKKADRDLKKMISDQGALRLDQNRVKDLDAELGVIRSEIAQIREDVGYLKSMSAKSTEPSKTDILKSPWVTAGSFVLALLALLIG